MVKVMVFGVFDGLHDGHRAFLQYAQKEGNYLIAVVTQDHIVEHQKGHLPQKNLAERFEHLKKVDGVDEVVIGDSELSTWEIIKKYNPDIIALGYDQRALHEDLQKAMAGWEHHPTIKVMPAYEPNPKR